MDYRRTSNGHLVSAGKIVILLATVATWTGCGGDGIERVELFGQVSYKGQLVESGYIVLVPLGNGIQSGAKIVNGTYEATGRGAVPVGKYRVRLSWLKEDKTPRTDGFNIPVSMNLLPYKYNKASKLTLDVPSGKGSMTQDYILD